MDITAEDRHDMQNDLVATSISVQRLFDIKRQVREVDDGLGGFIITSTCIETRMIDLQHLRGVEVVNIGGLGIEANYRGFITKEADILEQDTITSDSGVINYQVRFVQSLWDEHIEFFAKRLND